MTTPPDWAIAVPTTPAIHPKQSSQLQFNPPFTVQQLEAIGEQIIEAIIKQVLLAMFGSYLPTGWETQLQHYFDELNADIDFLTTLFGDLVSGDIIGALTTFFGLFNTNFARLPTTLQSDLQAIFTTASTLAQDILDTLLSFLTGTTVTGGTVADLTPALTTYAARVLNPAQIPSLLSTWPGTLDGSRLAGSVAASLINGALSSASLAANQLTAGIIPTGVTLPGAQLTGSVAAALISGVLGTGNIPVLPTSQISTTGSPFPQSLIPALTSGWGKTIDGSLLAGTVAASLVSGALSSATLAASALTSGAIPAGVTLPGGQLTGSVAAALISGVLGTGNIPTLPPGQISGPGTFAASLIPALTSGWGGTIDGTKLTGVINSALTVTGSTTLATIQSNGQQTIDGIANAVNATSLVNQAVSTVQSGLSGFFTNLFNAYNPSAPASTASASAATSTVATTAANTSTSLSTHTVDISSIQAQLPSFYGGGTGGLSETVSFSGGSLPAGFSTVTTHANASAKYNTAATTDAETVSGAWSVSDVYAKYLFLRANSTFTTYVYVKLQNNDPSGAAKSEIGCVVAGTKTVFQTFTLPSAGNVVVNSAYSLEAASYTFTVQGPGLDLSYTDSSHVSQLGSAYRYGGFGTEGYERAQQTFGTSGTYTVPGWAVAGTKFDLVGIGGGGGSNTGGYEGAPGTWNGVTLTYGTDIPTSTTAFTVTPGVGGASQAPATGNAPGANGSASTVAITGYSSSPFSAAGGLGAANTTAYFTPANNGAPNYTFHNASYAGSATGSAGNSGNTPGGGAGVSGGSATTGGYGEVIITAIDTSVPGSLGAWAFYDSAAAGPAISPVTCANTSDLSPSSYDNLTTVGSYVDLATTTDQVTVNIGSSGMAIIFLRATLNSSSQPYVNVGFALSGANTIAATDQNSVLVNVAGGDYEAIGPFFLKGLSAGATIFKMKYKQGSASTSSFWNRTIAVIPL